MGTTKMRLTGIPSWGGAILLVFRTEIPEGGRVVRSQSTKRKRLHQFFLSAIKTSRQSVGLISQLDCEKRDVKLRGTKPVFSFSFFFFFLFLFSLFRLPF